MVSEWEIEIPRLSGGIKRKAYIYLPVGYFGSGERYPVMYMFDGHNLFSDGEAAFGKSWGLADYLDYTETPLIVAAVGCNPEGNGRLSEYSPADFDFNGERIIGKGKIYMDWLVREFKPFIDENYRTMRGRAHTAVGGSSMGGLMTLYALAEYGKYSSRGAALSPSLWINRRQTAQMIKNGKFAPDTVAFADCGSREFGGRRGQRGAFAELCSVLIKKGVNLTSRVVPGGTHCEASWQKEIPYFMNALGFLPKN